MVILAEVRWSGSYLDDNGSTMARDNQLGATLAQVYLSGGHLPGSVSLGATLAKVRWSGGPFDQVSQSGSPGSSRGLAQKEAKEGAGTSRLPPGPWVKHLGQLPCYL